MNLFRQVKKFEEDGNDSYSPHKPTAEIIHEESIRDSLIAQGIPLEIAAAVLGYLPDQVAFVYATTPYVVKTTDGKRELITSWFGSSTEIWNLRNEHGWYDQIAEIIVSWRQSKTFSHLDSAPTETVRQELKVLSDGTLVMTKYRNVSKPGEFDGTIDAISVHTPNGTFSSGGRPGRLEYKMHIADYSNGLWQLIIVPNTRLSSYSMLSGQALQKPHLISPVKQDFPIVTSAANEDRQDLESTEEREFNANLHQQQGLSNDKVLELKLVVTELIKCLEPVVISNLKYNFWSLQHSVSALIDGVSRRPEQIWILNKRLSELTAQQRFYLTVVIGSSLENGDLQIWLANELSQQNMDEVARKTVNSLLLWMKFNGRETDDLEQIFDNAIAEVKQLAVNTPTVEHVEFDHNILNKAFDGYAIALLEQYLAYLIAKGF